MSVITSFDRSITLAVQFLPPGLHWFMVFITTVGSPVVCGAALLAAMLCAYVNKKKRLLISEMAVLIALPLASIIKELTKRSRPDTSYVQHMLIKSYSFPSGHAYSSLLVLGFFAYAAWRYMHSVWKWAVITGLILMILLVGVSRIYLGAHFPSDVTGGWILGSIILFAVIRFGLGSDDVR